MKKLKNLLLLNLVPIISLDTTNFLYWNGKASYACLIHNTVNLQTTHVTVLNDPLSRLKNLPILNF